MTKWAWELDGRSPIRSNQPIEVYDLMIFRPLSKFPDDGFSLDPWSQEHNTKRNADRNARERRTFKTGSSGKYK